MKDQVYQTIMTTAREKGAAYAVLIDPDRKNDHHLATLMENINAAEVDLILVGGSLIMDAGCRQRVAQIKEKARPPVVFFPGGLSQLSPDFDAMLFMSIISGRNPHYLIGEQVIAAPVVRDLDMETIATAYLLIDGGGSSAVQFMSNTTPIPINRVDIALAHALAAQYLGFKMAYLEAGSGAKQAVPEGMVRQVAEATEIPLIVGGGIRTAESARERAEAGATVIVTGTIIEEQADRGLLNDLAAAVHYREQR